MENKEYIVTASINTTSEYIQMLSKALDLDTTKEELELIIDLKNIIHKILVDQFTTPIANMIAKKAIEDSRILSNSIVEKANENIIVSID